MASSTLKDDKGKGREVAASSAPNTTAQDPKGKAREVNPQLNLSSPGRSLVDEEIFSPGAAAERRFKDPGPRLEGILGGGAGGLSSLLGMGSGRDFGGRTLGGLETSSGLGMMGGLGVGGGGIGNLGSSGRLGGGRTLGDMGGMGGLGGGINGLNGSLFGRPGPDLFRQGNGFGVGGNTNSEKTDNGNGGGGAGSQSSTTRTGTWSGKGIQSRLSDEGT